MTPSISTNISLQPSQTKIEGLLLEANGAPDKAVNAAIKNFEIATINA